MSLQEKHILESNSLAFKFALIIQAFMLMSTVIYQAGREGFMTTPVMLVLQIIFVAAQIWAYLIFRTKKTGQLTNKELEVLDKLNLDADATDKFYEAIETVGGHAPEFYNDYAKVKAYLTEHGEKVKETLGGRALLAPVNLMHLRADAACVLAEARQNEWMPPHRLTPIYLRAPQAERERAAGRDHTKSLRRQREEQRAR